MLHITHAVKEIKNNYYYHDYCIHCTVRKMQVALHRVGQMLTYVLQSLGSAWCQEYITCICILGGMHYRGWVVHGMYYKGWEMHAREVYMSKILLMINEK